ncbi:MAG: hypothetical protein ACK4GQ_04850 [Candidatus Hadarchaeales archaeon]
MKVSRPVLALPLLSLLVALCFYSWLDVENHLPYPTRKMIEDNPQAFVGKEVFIFGEIEKISGDEAKVVSGNSVFTVTPLSGKAGDLAEVVGLLGENFNISVKSSLVYDRQSYWMEFLRSLIGATILVFLYFSSWKFSWKKFRFEEVK